MIEYLLISIFILILTIFIISLFITLISFLSFVIFNILILKFLSIIKKKLETKDDNLKFILDKMEETREKSTKNILLTSSELRNIMNDNDFKPYIVKHNSEGIQYREYINSDEIDFSKLREQCKIKSDNKQ